MVNFIELIGRPGSGKSTVVNELLNVSNTDKTDELIGAYNTSIRSMQFYPAILDWFVPYRLDKLIAKVFGWENKAKIAFQSEYNQFDRIISRDMEHHLKGTGLHDRLLQKYIKLEMRYWIVNSKRHHEAVFLDEGFLHKSMTLYCSRWENRENQWDPNNPDPIKQYISAMPTPASAIIIDIDPQTRVSRINNDENRPDEDRSINMAHYERQQNLLDYIEESFRGTRTEIIRVDNSGSINKTIDDIITHSKIIEDIIDR